MCHLTAHERCVQYSARAEIIDKAAGSAQESLVLDTTNRCAHDTMTRCPKVHGRHPHLQLSSAIMAARTDAAIRPLYDILNHMKPASFQYARPETVDGALGLLGEHGDDVKVLAGGQSLIPMMNLRLARPSHLVDISAIPELSYIRTESGTVTVGAASTHTTLLEDRYLRAHLPVLAEAIGHVAHVQVRNRGTVGGSIAHADPAAELPVIAVALGASVAVASTRGMRVIHADDLFESIFTTSIMADEMITEIRWPIPPPETRGAFVEIARRHGDFALAGCCAQIALEGDGLRHGSVTLLGAADRPLKFELGRWSGRALRESTRDIARTIVEEAAPRDAGELSAAVRSQLLVTAVARCLNQLDRQEALP
jgi:aerobic carbon-monoxide dehydrogenase medium subunit